MSAETDPVPPVPEHTPPLQEDAIPESQGKYFNHAWTRWFTSLRAKINVIDNSLVNLIEVGAGPGIVAKNGAAWLLRTITGTADRVKVDNGNGAAGNPTVDVITADLVAGSNVSFTGSGSGRIIGTSNLTINATGGGGGYPFVPPPTTGWSWVNQGSAVIESTSEYQTISDGTAASLNCRMRTRAAPSTPYVITSCIECSMLKNSNSAIALFWRDSATGRLIYAGLSNGNFTAASYNSPTSFAGVAYSVPSYASTLLWHRIVDDGTDRGIYFSGNGYDWIPLFIQANNAFLTADEVGFMTLVNGNVTAPTARLVHWEVS